MAIMRVKSPRKTKTKSIHETLLQGISSSWIWFWEINPFELSFVSPKLHDFH